MARDYCGRVKLRSLIYPENRKSGVIYHDIAVLGAVFNGEECKIMLNKRFQQN
jgi:hypothetical protein